jgi:hypothetical protein
MNNAILRNAPIFEGTSYADDGDFSCGSSFGSLAELIRWLISHPHHGPGDPVISPQVTSELTQVAQGLITFVGSRGVQDAGLRSRVGAEGLQRTAKALANLQQHAQSAN